jgi:hypothetical protein
MSRTPGEAVFRWAVAPQEPLYALLDAAREPGGPEQAEKSGVAFESLFAGQAGNDLAHVAPYVVEFRPRSSFGQWWFGKWGGSAGVLIETRASLAELRRHFRTLLIVRGEDGDKYYFRFYDPRVLRVFLPKCDADEARRFLGPISAIYCEGAEGKELLTFRPGDEGVSTKVSPVPETQNVAATARAADARQGGPG